MTPASRAVRVCVNSTAALILALSASFGGSTKAADCDESVTAEIRLQSHHPWRPPFGLERVGQPARVLVEIAATARPYREYWLASYVNGKEDTRQMLSLKGPRSSGDKPSFFGEANFEVYPEEVALHARCRFNGDSVEVARRRLHPPLLEAEAQARPEQTIHPVDLGAILVPHDWLLLAPRQRAVIDVAAIDRSRDHAGAKVVAAYQSSAEEKVSASFEMVRGRRTQTRLELPPVSQSVERDILQVKVLGAEGNTLWQKEVQTMRVKDVPQWPAFGAVETKLRYDAPISVRNPRTGALSSMEYSAAWKPELRDVVVFLPNGSRFVFWRGSCYIPFWASRHNTGVSYEWAETVPPADGFTDSVEPLMDKELRYGRVEIVESTSARIHVRWIYQSNDFNYKVWGDSPSEDFYFYPDGYGTRVLTLRTVPEARYEVLEYIVMTPQGAFPFEVLNPKTADILFLDGQKREITFPGPNEKPSTTTSFSRSSGLGEPRDVPAIYRIRFNKNETAGAISFNPVDTHLPQYLFSPFYDRGEMVTPFYWGSHWPLARGNSTGWAIDDRIYLTPAHNSVLGWGLERQTPQSSGQLRLIDTLGQSKLMQTRRWTWLIGMNDDGDARLLDWAHSFSGPPSLELRGARLDADSYAVERRAIRLVVENSTVEITFKHGVRYVNPVFELRHAPKNLTAITLNNRPLGTREYVWDGQVVWVNADIDGVTSLQFEFGSASN